MQNDDKRHDDNISETSTKSPPIEWHSDIEQLLVSWCDHSKCYIWMHSKVHDEVDKRLQRIMIIIHILSTLSGLSNIITGDITIGGFKISWLYGGMTILLTSLSLLQEKLGLQEKCLNHRRLSLQSLSIKMKIEEVLSLPRNARGDCKTFMKLIKHDIHSAMLEKNAAIPEHIREACRKEFERIPGFDIPDSCGQVEHTRVHHESGIGTGTAPERIILPLITTTPIKRASVLPTVRGQGA